MKEVHKKSLKLIDDLLKELTSEEIKELISKYKEPEIRPDEMSREDIYNLTKNNHYCTIGDLKRHIEKYNLSDDSPIVVQRVEDFYFQKSSWKVYLKEGWNYHSTIKSNQNMKDEISRRERGEEPHYDSPDPSMHICEDEDFLFKMKDQYHPVFSPVYYREDEDILFLALHY